LTTNSPTSQTWYTAYCFAFVKDAIKSITLYVTNHNSHCES
jgi:hypothetical protein